MKSAHLTGKKRTLNDRFGTMAPASSVRTNAQCHNATAEMNLHTRARSVIPSPRFVSTTPTDARNTASHAAPCRHREPESHAGASAASSLSRRPGRAWDGRSWAWDGRRPGGVGWRRSPPRRSGLWWSSPPSNALRNPRWGGHASTHTHMYANTYMKRACNTSHTTYTHALLDRLPAL